MSTPALREDIASSVEAAATELISAGSGALVLNGLNTENAERLALAINLTLGSKSFNTSKFVYTANGNDQAAAELVADAATGLVDTIVALGINPAYQMPLVDLNGVNIVAIADREDETASKAKVAFPVSHYLESWSDFRAVDGHYAVGQPTISPYSTVKVLWK